MARSLASTIALLIVILAVHADAAASPWRILGITRGASQAEIKKAYRKKALKYHPDKCEEAKRKRCEKMFVRASQAYEQLISGGGGPRRARKGADPGAARADPFDLNAAFRVFKAYVASDADVQRLFSRLDEATRRFDIKADEAKDWAKIAEALAAAGENYVKGHDGKLDGADLTRMMGDLIKNRKTLLSGDKKNLAEGLGDILTGALAKEEPPGPPKEKTWGEWIRGFFGGGGTQQAQQQRGDDASSEL